MADITASMVKDLREMTQILLPLFDYSSDRPGDHVLFAPIHNPRATALDDLARAASLPCLPVAEAARWNSSPKSASPRRRVDASAR